MTAVRFALMNPDRVTQLVLEDPLGLADYRIGIAPQSEETLYEHELNWTDPAVIRDYVKADFVHPDRKVFEPLADVLVRVTLSPDYPQWAPSAALTFQMIYQQTVRHEYAWRSKPSWYLLVTDDRMIPLPAQRQMAERAGCDDRRGARQPRRLRLHSVRHCGPHHPSG